MPRCLDASVPLCLDAMTPLVPEDQTGCCTLHICLCLCVVASMQRGVAFVRISLIDPWDGCAHDSLRSRGNRQHKSASGPTRTRPSQAKPAPVEDPPTPSTRSEGTERSRLAPTRQIARLEEPASSSPLFTLLLRFKLCGTIYLHSTPSCPPEPGNSSTTARDTPSWGSKRQHTNLVPPKWT